MSWLLILFKYLAKHWKPILLTLAVISLVYYIQSLRVAIDDKEKQISSLVQDRIALREELQTCYSDQKIASEVSDEYESKITDLERKHSAAIKRLRGTPSCIPIIRPAK